MVPKRLNVFLGSVLLLGWCTVEQVQAAPPAPRVFSVPAVDKKAPKPFSFAIKSEYRTRFIRIEPLDLAGLEVAGMGWAEQRLRLDVTLARPGLGAIYLQADLLDGVLFGDNGSFGFEPHVNSGLGIASKQGNRSGWTLGLAEGADPFKPQSYVPVLVPIAPFHINYAYGEILLPFGLVRIGRQPIGDVGTISLNDGRTGRNRWGASWYHQSTDRILFGTKISEAFKKLAGGKNYKIDKSMDNGVFIGAAYDYLVQDELYRSSDDLQQIAFQVDWRAKSLCLGRLKIKNFRFKSTLSYRWEERYKTGIFGIPFQLKMDIGPLRLRADVTLLEGSTRELSAGFAELTARNVVDQRISAVGARVVLEGKVGPVTLVGEWAYASGDEDPRPETPMTMFTWPRDTNLGLLLFERTLAFQSGRSAAVGIENLKQVGADSFPLTELSTEGRVTNVNAFFPQVFWDPTDALRLKFGALFAWSAKDTVDAIRTTLAWDGQSIKDDAVNYNGGKPGGYWGTEIDLGIEYRYRKLFHIIVEGAVLFPGQGLRDENGDGVISWMLETRLMLTL